MNQWTRRFGFPALLLMALAGRCFAAAPPVETFYKALAYPQMVLSPSGKYIAALYPANGTTNLVVIDIAGRNSKALSGFSPPVEVVDVGWDTDDRLIYGFDARAPSGAWVYNVAAVNRDGKNPLMLVDNLRNNATRYVNEQLVDWTLDDPNSILLASDQENESFPSVYEVNTTSAWHAMESAAASSRQVFSTRRTKIVPAPGRKCQYVADNAGVVRLCATHETNGARRLLYRAKDGGEWTTIAEYIDPAKFFGALGFAPDNRTLYVLSNRDRDTIALFEFDPDTQKIGRLIFEAPGLDLDHAIWSADHRQLTGVSYFDSQTRVHYFDAHTAQLQKDLQEVFPGDAVGIQNFSQDGKKAIVLVTNERTPGKYYLYDEAKQTVEILAARAPWIDPKQMSAVKAISYKARDGLEISAYLTIPNGKEPKKLPLIVYPHGGPYAIREIGTWDPDAQFLASRGYAVLQMNFRGSGGYGTKFRAAGYREWGGKMQDDVTDAVQWAVNSGVADAERVCIFGASYGGYAALMGAAMTPELYKCAISYSGVTDLVTLFQPRVAVAGFHSDRSPEEIEYWNRVMGDRRDTTYLRERSPVANAAKIRAPVFIAHGEQDLIVPFANATDMRDALVQAHKTVEFFSRPDEGHGFDQEANQIALFTQIEQFLQKYNPADK